MTTFVQHSRLHSMNPLSATFKETAVAGAGCWPVYTTLSYGKVSNTPYTRVPATNTARIDYSVGFNSTLPLAASEWQLVQEKREEMARRAPCFPFQPASPQGVHFESLLTPAQTLHIRNLGGVLSLKPKQTPTILCPQAGKAGQNSYRN